MPKLSGQAQNLHQQHVPGTQLLLGCRAGQQKPTRRHGRQQRRRRRGLPGGGFAAGVADLQDSDEEGLFVGVQHVSR